MIEKINKLKSQRGFTLIEVSLVVVIGGILLSLFSTSLINMISGTKEKTTLTRIMEVDEALRQYASVNNRLPCPAALDVKIETANYGRETNCAAPATSPGTVDDPTYPVRYGFIPTRTLNLPDSHGYDAWGSRLIYAVTKPLTSQATYDLRNGKIDIIDSNGNSTVTPTRSITYVVLSVGKDRRGGWNSEGFLGSPCADASALDGENCDNDATFRSTLAFSNNGNATHFDDYIRYEGNFESAYVPSGAIMAFDSNTCPNGWAPLANAAGRTVIGSGNYAQNAHPSTVDASDYNGESFGRGTTGGFATAIAPAGMSDTAQYKSLPPYMVYLYCKKN